MKTFATALLSLTLFTLPIVHAAESAAVKEKFYGKITAINAAQKKLTAHNAKSDTDAEFTWDAQTGVVSNKKPIDASALQVGQSLYVAYVAEGNMKKATYISVRTPFKKASAK